jgi:hypothetical protein
MQNQTTYTHGRWHSRTRPSKEAWVPFSVLFSGYPQAAIQIPFDKPDGEIAN